jgi:hypothetical protein
LVNDAAFDVIPQRHFKDRLERAAVRSPLPVRVQQLA